MKILSLLLFLITLPASAVTHKEIQSLNSTIKTLNEADLSCSANNDCAAIAAGTKACGGPSYYFISSKQNKDHEQLLRLAKKSNELEKLYNKEHSTISTCSMTPVPSVLCEDSICIKKM